MDSVTINKKDVKNFKDAKSAIPGVSKKKV